MCAKLAHSNYSFHGGIRYENERHTVLKGAIMSQDKPVKKSAAERLPVDRRDYLKYTGVLASTSMFAGQSVQARESNAAKKNGISAPVNLRIEHEQNPNNIDIERSIRFSWQVPSWSRNVEQSAYEIRVATVSSSLNEADVWNSGHMDSSRSTSVPYEGPDLEPDTAYKWSVRIWDEEEKKSDWSNPAQFRTALLDDAEAWDGEWIGVPEGNEDDLSPQLRTEVSLDGEIQSARAHVVTLGYGELYVNGNRIGDEQLNPAWTEYEKTTLYTTYDIENSLAKGENAFGIWLGRGWYSLEASDTAWYVQWEEVGPPSALVQINITYADGTTESIVTDKSWTTTSSPIVENHIYDGETYDAREEKNEWAETGFDDGYWDSATNTDPPSEEFALKPQRTPPIQVTDEIEPDTIVDRGDRYLVDFGQNMAGWIELSIDNPDEGDTIVLKHAESLITEDDELTRDLETGTLSRGDLRGADAMDTYIAQGDDQEVYEPRFTYHGFRYATVEGYPGELTKGDLIAKVVHTDFDMNGSFACSNDDLNRVQHNAIWGLRSNAMGIPTDCPNRDERFGWTGDVHQNVRADYYNFDPARFHEKWLDDIEDNQRPEGNITNTIPFARRRQDAEDHPWWEIADPNWGKTYVLLPWRGYLHTGNEQILKDHYDGLRAYVDFWHEEAEGHIVPEEMTKYGDWLSFEPQASDPALFSTFAHYQTTDCLARIAETLGYNEDARKYRERAEAIADAFHDEFFNPGSSNYGTGTQATYVLPLFGGLVPDEYKEKVVEKLVEKIRTEDDGKLQTGFIATRPLIFTLVEHGYEELAYNVVSQPEQPGWVYMVNQGATTMWERWDSDERLGGFMNSMNHRPWTLISEWFYRIIAGIDAAEPGFRTVEIAPVIPDDLDWAEGSVDTVRGEVSSRWERTNEGLQLHVTIPGNATGTVRVPTLGGKKVRVREGDKPIWNNGNRTRPNHSGVKSVKHSDDKIVVEVGSGDYQFELEQIGNSRGNSGKGNNDRGN